MKTQFDFYSFFNLFGAINGFFFAAVFLKIKRGNPRSNRFAALLLANLAVIAAGSFCAYSGYFIVFPKIQKLFSPLLFMMGPLLYFYVRSLFKPEFRMGGKLLLHFLPVVVNYLFYIPFYLKSDLHKVEMLNLGITPVVRVIRILAFLHFFVYFLFILREIRICHQLAQNRYSSLSRLKANWIISIGVALSTVLFVNIVPELSVPIFSELANIWEALVIIYLGYKGLTHPLIFLSDDFSWAAEKEDQPIVPPDRQKEYVERIADFMRDVKPFLDPDLSIGSFAERLGIPVNYCSYVINRHWQMNFFHFVNHFRVAEFKRRLLDGRRNENILITAFTVGFNSKSTFNAVFKKFEGMTPSQYLKSQSSQKGPTSGKN